MERKNTDIALIMPEMTVALFLCDITDLILTVCIIKYVNISKRMAIFAKIHTSELEVTIVTQHLSGLLASATYGHSERSK